MTEPTTEMAAIEGNALQTELAGTSNIALAIWFNEALFNRAKTIATYISKAEGFAPPHLIGKPEACFAVVERSLVWKLSPFAVAQSTYSPAPGKIGYEGKLCQAILEASGKLAGGVKFEHVGDWSKIQGKFKIKESDKGKKYAVIDWKESDETGVGVRVSAQIKGELEPRTLLFELRQAFPRNSTLWATDPKTQICYTAVRRFASVAVPALFMGVPFDDDVSGMIDVTPTGRAPARPTKDDFANGGDKPKVTDVEEDSDLTPKPEPAEPYPLVGADGEVMDCDLSAFANGFYGMVTSATTEAMLHAAWENNSPRLERMRENGEADMADWIAASYSKKADELKAAAPTRDIPAENDETTGIDKQREALRDQILGTELMAHLDMLLDKNRDLIRMLAEKYPDMHKAMMRDILAARERITGIRK